MDGVSSDSELQLVEVLVAGKLGVNSGTGSVTIWWYVDC